MISNKDKINIIITGSNGWISQNFISKLKELNIDSNIYLVNRKTGLDYLKDIKKKNLHNIFLIHNSFVRAEKISSKLGIENFMSESSKNLDLIIDFLNGSDVKGIFYPSSGSVYKIRKKDNELYSIYADQKLKEEKIFEQFSKSKDIVCVIPRIFSSIGPHMNNPNFFPLSSFIIQALKDKKISIESTANNIYSFCFLENLTELALKIMFENKIVKTHQFDAVNINLSLLEQATTVANILKVEKKDISYNFNMTHAVEKYTGNGDSYKKLLKQHMVSNKTLNVYVEKVINDIKINL